MSNRTQETGSSSSPRFGVRNAYGEPQEIDGVTFTPVALVLASSGRSAGEGVDSEEERSVSIPLGVYVHREEGLRFEPNWVTFTAVAVPFVCVAGRALARIIRALKK